MIKVTTTYGNEWINPSLILMISRNLSSGSIIELHGSSNKIFALESPEEIINMLP